MKTVFRSLLSLAIVSFILPQSVSAQTISEGQAMENARNFLNVKGGIHKMSSINGTSATASSALSLAYQAKSDEGTAYYVFNIGEDDGFVIAGGDEVAKEILAYVPHGHFDYETIPENVKWWLEEYERAITYANKHGQQSSDQSSAPKRAPKAVTVEREYIPNMIETSWGYKDPYNRAIPKLVNSLTGEEFQPITTNPTAAQIMKHFNYPEHGVGRRTRVLDYSQINAYYPGSGPCTPEFGTVVHDINFEETTYDWGNMLNNYTGEETEEQINAIATLMYHVDIACDAVYGVDTSTSGDPEEGLKTYFGYSPKATKVQRDGCDDQTWEEIIYTELKMNRPVLYQASGKDKYGNYVAKDFIIDGYYPIYNLFRFNWGVGGKYNGYWELTSTTGEPILGGYEYHHEAVVRLQPATLDSDEVPEFGDTFWIDGIKYSIVSNLYKTVEVARPDSTEPQYSGSINIPATVHYQGLEYSVVGLGLKCFEKDSSIIPNLIITEVSLPEGLRYIHWGAFYDRTILESIEIPNSVKAIGPYAFNLCISLQSFTLPNLTKISEACFSNCFSLTKIIIPEGVSTIERSAFAACYELNFVELPATVKNIEERAFSGDDNLDIMVCKAITPPETTKNYSPFSNAVKSGYLLVPEESIDLYRSSKYWKDWGNIFPIESTDISMIGKTVAVENIIYKVLPTTVAVLSGYYASRPTITIPEVIEINGKEYEVTSIEPNAFMGTNCEVINLPESLTTIKSKAFYACHVKNINIPDNVSYIGERAFSYCTNLESIRLPEGIESVPLYCFLGCDNLRMVELPKSMKRMGKGEEMGDITYECKNLFTIVCKAEEVPTCSDYRMSRSEEGTLYVPASKIEDYRTAPGWKHWRFIKSIDELDMDKGLDTTYEDGVEYRLLDHGAVALKGDGSTSYTIPGTIEYKGRTYDVISIGAKVFYNSEITSIQLPPSLHSISNSAFEFCWELKSINLPNNIEIIGPWAFHYCNSLTSMDIPISVIDIDDYAFMDCSSLSSITVENDNPDNIKLGIRVFDGVPTSTCTLYVPKGSKELYAKADQWSDFVHIVELGDVNGDDAYTISDITLTANHIMGTLGVGNDFYVEAADLDNDGMVLVNDLTAIIDLVLAADYAASAPALAPHRERVATMPVFEIGETNGSAIEVCVQPGYIATQFDVILPEGARLMEASLAGMNAQTYKMSYRSLDDSRVRVVIFSMDNAEMSGELISLTVQGEGDVLLTNALVNEIQPDGTIVEKDIADIHASISGNASGISEIESDSPSSDYIYNLNGQKVSDDHKGFVIKNGKKILSK